MKKKDKANYVKLGVIVIFTIFVAFLICNLYRNFDGNKETSSYISKHVSTISYNELASATTELSSNSFIYLSFVGSRNIYDLEKQLRKILKQYELEDNFIYVDCTNDIESDYTIKSLKNIFVVGNKEIVLPAIIYFKDNSPTDYIDSSDGLFDAGSFSQLLDKYEIESSSN